MAAAVRVVTRLNYVIVWQTSAFAPHVICAWALQPAFAGLKNREKFGKGPIEYCCDVCGNANTKTFAAVRRDRELPGRAGRAALATPSHTSTQTSTHQHSHQHTPTHTVNRCCAVVAIDRVWHAMLWPHRKLPHRFSRRGSTRELKLMRTTYITDDIGSKKCVFAR